MESPHARTLRVSLFVAVTFVSTHIATAQNFNIDVGSNTAFPRPSSSFGAALGQVGTWNAVSGVLGGTQALLDVRDVGGSLERRRRTR